MSPCQDIPLQVFMVRLVPTADPEILLFAPADQLAQPTEQAKGKWILPRKSLLPKKPSQKAAHPCKDRQSQFSLQQETQSGSGFPSFFQPEPLHREFKSLPNHQGMMTTLDSDVCGEGQSATSHQASCSGSPKMQDHLSTASAERVTTQHLSANNTRFMLNTLCPW